MPTLSQLQKTLPQLDEPVSRIATSLPEVPLADAALPALNAAPTPDLPQITPGLISLTGRALGGGLSAIGNILDTPGSMVRDTLALKNPFDQLLDPLGYNAEENRTTGRQLARQYGLAGEEDTYANWWGGFAAEVALDPLTYTGIGGLTKAGQAASKSKLLDKSTKAFNDAALRQAKATAKGVGKDAKLKRQSRFSGFRTTPRMVIEQEADLAKRQQMLQDFYDAGGTEALLDQPMRYIANFRFPWTRGAEYSLISNEARNDLLDRHAKEIATRKEAIEKYRQLRGKSTDIEELKNAFAQAYRAPSFDDIPAEAKAAVEMEQKFNDWVVRNSEQFDTQRNVDMADVTTRDAELGDTPPGASPPPGGGPSGPGPSPRPTRPNQPGPQGNQPSGTQAGNQTADTQTTPPRDNEWLQREPEDTSDFPVMGKRGVNYQATNKAFRDISPAHATFDDRLASLGLEREDRMLVQTVFQDSNLRFIDSWESAGPLAGRRSSEIGRAYMKSGRIEVAARRVASDPGEIPLTTLHEIGHIALKDLRQATPEFGQEVDRLIGDAIADGSMLEYFRRAYGGRRGNAPRSGKDIELAEYFSKDPDEIFAEMFTHYASGKLSKKMLETTPKGIQDMLLQVWTYIRDKFARIMQATPANDPRHAAIERVLEYATGFRDDGDDLLSQIKAINASNVDASHKVKFATQAGAEDTAKWLVQRYAEKTGVSMVDPDLVREAVKQAYKVVPEEDGFRVEIDRDWFSKKTQSYDYIRKYNTKLYNDAVAEGNQVKAAELSKRIAALDAEYNSGRFGVNTGPRLVGKVVDVVTGSKDVPSMNATYEVVELKDILPSHSHDKTFDDALNPVPNEAYPSKNPRNYKRGNSEAAKVDRFAQERQPGYFVSEHPGFDDGPPAIDKDGNVVNGNGRAMTLQLAASRGDYSWYKDYLRERAGQFGIDPERIDEFENPVLVRRMNFSGKEDSKLFDELAAAGNIQTGQSMSPARMANTLNKMVDDELLESVGKEGDETFTEAVASDTKTARNLRDRIWSQMPPAERDRMFDSKNKLTAHGKEVISMMGLNRVMPIELVERMAGSRAAIFNGVAGAIPQLIKIAREGGDLNIVPDMMRALDFIEQNPGIRNISDLRKEFAQPGMFDGASTGFELPESTKAMAELIMSHAVGANGNASPNIFRQRLKSLIATINERRDTSLLGPDGRQADQIIADALQIEKRPGMVMNLEPPSFKSSMDRGGDDPYGLFDDMPDDFGFGRELDEQAGLGDEAGDMVDPALDDTFDVLEAGADAVEELAKRGDGFDRKYNAWWVRDDMGGIIRLDTEPARRGAGLDNATQAFVRYEDEGLSAEIIFPDGETLTRRFEGEGAAKEWVENHVRKFYDDPPEDFLSSVDRGEGGFGDELEQFDSTFEVKSEQIDDDPDIRASISAAAEATSAPKPKATKAIAEQFSQFFENWRQSVPQDMASAIVDYLDRGGDLFFKLPLAAEVAALFRPELYGATTEAGREISKARAEAVQAATDQYRTALAPVVRAVHDSDLFDFNKMLAAGKSEADAIKELNRNAKVFVDLLEGLPVNLDDFPKGQWDKVTPQIAVMKKELASTREFLIEKGLNVAMLDDMFVEYFHRQLATGSKNRGRASINPKIGLVVEMGVDAQKQRDNLLRDLVGGTGVIQDMSIDTNISGLRQRASFVKKRVKRQDIAGQLYELKDGTLLRANADEIGPDAEIGMPDGSFMTIREYVARTYGDRLFEGFDPDMAYDTEFDQLITYMMDLDPVYATEQIPLFGRNPIAAYSRYIQDAYRVGLMAEHTQQLIGKNAMLKKYAQRQGALLSVREAVRNKDVYWNDNALETIIKSMNPDTQSTYNMLLESNVASDLERLLTEGKPIRRKVDGRPTNLRFKEDPDGPLTGMVLRKVGDEEELVEVQGVIVEYGQKQGRQATPLGVKKDAELTPYENIIDDPEDYLRTKFVRGETAEDFLEEFGIEAEIARDMNRFMKPFTVPQELSNIENAARRYTNVMKMGLTALWPAFHVRNNMSAMWMNMVLGERDPRFTGAEAYRAFLQPYLDSKNLILGTGEITDLDEIPGLLAEVASRGVKGESLNAELRKALQDEIFAMGIIGEKVGLAAEHIGDETDNLFSQFPGLDTSLWSTPPQNRTMIDKWLPTAVKDGITLDPLTGEIKRVEKDMFVGATIGRDVAKFSESLNRISQYIAARRNGYSPQAARDMVDKLHVNYSNLSAFESRVMRMLIPFYSFSRGVLPTILEDLVQRPGGVQATVIKAANRSRDPNAVVPDHIADTVALPVGETSDGSKSYLTGFGLPFEDTLNIMDGVLRMDPYRAGRELIGRSNPIIKAPLEAITGRSFFQDGPVGGRELTDLDPPIGRTIQNVQDLATGERTREADPFIGLPLEFAVANSPLSRAVSTARTMTDPRKWEQPWNLGLNLLSGVRVNDVSPQAQDAIYSERLGKAIKEIGGRTFVREYVSEERLAKMSPEEQELARQLLEEKNKVIPKRNKIRREEKEAAQPVET